MIQNRIPFFLFFATLIFGIAGCSTMQPIDSNMPREEVMGQIGVGSQIEIKTKTGEIRSITVSSISDTHIESSGEQFLISEIEIVAQKKLNTVGKGMVFGAGLAIGALMQALMLALILGFAL